MAQSGSEVRLRLYVAPGAPNSAAAERNLQTLLAGAADPVLLEVLDVFEHAERALEDGVLVTPMLVRVTPEPRVRMAGSFADGSALLVRLGIDGGSE